MNNNKTILIDGVRYHKEPKKKNPCEGCCYGPCVSFCMKKVLGQKEVPANA